MSFSELVIVLKNYGVKIVYNLDGGGLIIFYFNGKVIN